MTGADDERLASIRSQRDREIDEPQYQKVKHFAWVDVDCLLRLLDEARAELADLQSVFDRMWDADQRAIKVWQKAHPGTDLLWPDRAKMSEWFFTEIARLEKIRTGYLEIMWKAAERQEQLEAELSRLRSPSSADMVERARAVAGKIGYLARGPYADFDQAVTIVATALSTVAREAREAAIEECAQAALEYRDEADAGKYPDIGDPSHSLGQGFAANRIAKKLRALSGTAPQAGWRPIDTAPTAMRCLVASSVLNPRIAIKDDRDGRWFCQETKEEITPTVWYVGLPSPPTEDTK